MLQVGRLVVLLQPAVFVFSGKRERGAGGEVSKYW